MKIKLFSPNKPQKEIIDGFIIGNEDVKWGIGNFGRQTGKSLLAINTLIYWALNKSRSNIVYITPYMNQSEGVYQAVCNSASDFVASKNSMTKRVIFKNGSVILFRSSENQEALRGYSFDYGILDEAAWIKPDVWQTAIRPIFAVKGKKVLVISTPWIKNDFYEYFQLGLSEDPKFSEYKSFYAKSIDNPFFPLSELEAARATMTEEMVKQEYYAEFVDSAGGVFQNIYDSCKINKYTTTDKENIYFIGVDIALGGKDYTCVSVMNEHGHVVNIERWQESNTEVQIGRIRELIGRYNIGRGNIEINQERGIAQNIRKDYLQIKEWTTTRKNKPVMIQNLKKDLEDGVVLLPSNKLNQFMYREFGDFTFESKAGGYISYSHPPGGHDDTIIATALANEARVPKRYGKKIILV